MPEVRDETAASRGEKVISDSTTQPPAAGQPTEGAQPTEAGQPTEAAPAVAQDPKETRRDQMRDRVEDFGQRFKTIDERTLLLRYIQPGLVGLIDGTLSTLAPIFAAAISANSRTALLVGLATAVGAGISMGFSEALSDTGEETGRGSAVARGVVTGLMTTLGGVFHSLPFVIHDVHTALVVAGVVVACELIVISLVRKRFLNVPLRLSMVQVALAGALIVAAGVLLGSA